MTKLKKNILITGGAGFIGSNLVEALLDDRRIGLVRVLDNLSTGNKENIVEFLDRTDFEFVLGDIRDFDTCLLACKDMDLVSHQAALGSVPRSIKDPLTTDRVNSGGTVNMFYAAKESNVQRIVFAASSSTYGDSEALPKVEDNIGRPLSPYAITKYVNELYADVFSRTYQSFEYIGLRYFNIFGPKQDPNGAYAAVIPLFINAALDKIAPTINGDGSFSRDFTYVQNAVHANILALFSENENAVNQVYNVACGKRTTLNELWTYICNETGVDVPANYGPTREGDIPHSLADIGKIKSLLGYKILVDIKKGLKKSIKYYKNQRDNANIGNCKSKK